MVIPERQGSKLTARVKASGLSIRSLHFNETKRIQPTVIHSIRSSVSLDTKNRYFLAKYMQRWDSIIALESRGLKQILVLFGHLPVTQPGKARLSSLVCQLNKKQCNPACSLINDFGDFIECKLRLLWYR